MRRTIDARLGLTREGTPGTSDWVIRMPGVVGTLLGITWAVFLIGVVMSAQARFRFEYPLSFVPGRLGAALAGRPGVTLWEGAGPLVTHLFVHANLAHVALNSVGLLIFGTAVARRLRVEARGGSGAWNTVVFLAFFAASGIAGALLYAAFNAGSATPMVGASGAISGLMAGAMRFALRAFVPYGPSQGALAPPGAPPVLVTTIAYVGLNLLTPLGLGALTGSGGLSIAWESHIGGYLFGLYAFGAFDRAARREGLG